VEEMEDCTTTFFPEVTMAFRSEMLYNKESYEMRLEDLPQEEEQLVQWGEEEFSKGTEWSATKPTWISHSNGGGHLS
jgi:hypothetical protein